MKLLKLMTEIQKNKKWVKYYAGRFSRDPGDETFENSRSTSEDRLRDNLAKAAPEMIGLWQIMKNSRSMPRDELVETVEAIGLATYRMTKGFPDIEALSPPAPAAPRLVADTARAAPQASEEIVL